MTIRKGARQRREARRLARKLFKTTTRQPPEVFVAYLKGLVSGAELRQAEDIAYRDLPLVDIFGKQVSGRNAAIFVEDDGDWEAGARSAPAPVYH